MKFLLLATVCFAFLAVSSAQHQQFIELDVSDAIQAIQQLDRPSAKILTDNLLIQKDDDCHKCIGKGVVHILEETWKHVETECKNATGKVEKARCDWYLSHKNETLGYTSVVLQPGAISWGYCVGKGKCKHGNKTDILPDQSVVSGFSTGSIDTLKAILNEETEKSIEKEERRWNRLPEKIERKFSKLTEEEIEENQTDEDEVNGGLLCKLCLHFTTEHVLKGKIKKIIKACEKTKCPVQKKWCDWANANRQFVRGQIYAHVTPYKYAIGYCLGAKVCPHPPPSSWNSYIKKHTEEEE